MTAQTGEVEMPANALQAQLFRYAQDIESLMQQQYRLQQHHQMLLQSLGRDIQTTDQLPALLRRACSTNLMTDPRGTVIEASAPFLELVSSEAADFCGMSIGDVLESPIGANLERLTDRFFETNGSGLCLQLQVRLPAGLNAARRPFEAIVLQQRQGAQTGLHWFLIPFDDAVVPASRPLEVLLENFKSEQGLMLAETDGTIRTVSPGYEQLSGYSLADLKGKKPALMSSGRHSAQFFASFWQDLQETGTWNGTMFNRRKSGQIFLIWQSIITIKGLDGQPLLFLASVTDLNRKDTDRAELKSLAYHDPLTGLPNRRLLIDTFNDRLAIAQKEQTEVSVLFIDLDKFKPINDELGHDVGDQVLRQVAMRMQVVMHPGDFLARVGGDEFVVLLCGTQRAGQAEHVATVLQQMVREPIQAGRRTVSVGASIGCARYPADGPDMEVLLQHADSAMYLAKRSGLPFFSYNTAALSASVPDLQFDIWKAIERGQLHLNFQPQRSTDGSGRTQGCEVLVRWDHPQHGAIAAQVFIPIAEKNGAIVPIGKWVLSEACRYLSDWRSRGLSPFSISVNVSLQQLRDVQFARFVQQLLEQHALPPESLVLEFSESDTLLFRAEDTRRLRTLRDIGVRLSIDDFGASFSILTRLRSLSVSELKINSQFVQELETNSATRLVSQSLLAVGQILGVDVIAQGVENSVQASMLHEQGCQVMQGYYAGAPVTGDAFIGSLQTKG